MCYWCVILAPSAPRRPHLCCWRCRSRSPELRLKSWLCWTPARRKGWAAGSEPRARAALVLREQIKTTFILQVHHISQMFLETPSVAYRHRGGGTDSRRGLWPATTLLLHRSRKTPLHCSYPAVPRSPLSWPPDTQTTLFIRPLTHWTLVSLTLSHTHSLINHQKKQPSTSVHPRYYCTDTNSATVDH